MEKTKAAARQHLRQQLRSARKGLDRSAQRAAEAGIIQTLAPQLDSVSRVGLYLANDGEVNLTALIGECWRRGIATALPVLHPFCAGHLLFLRYGPDSDMRPNQYGILEPRLDCRDIVPIQDLDLLLMPLVGFDMAGNRLGMGGGFYDRTLARAPAHRPRRVGIAHECQRVDALPTAPWDVPLHGIATPTRLLPISD